MAPVTAIDLFCGAGGLTQGFTDAGIEVSLASDLWKPAADTHKENFPHIRFVQEDVREIQIKDLIGPFGRKPLIVAGGPPCQGFSSAGARRIEDQRNTLVREFALKAVALEPEVILFENVEGFLTSAKGRYIIELFDPLVEAGYLVSLQKLNVANFGVPQLRKRVIVIAARGRLPNAIAPTHDAHGAPGVHLAGRGLPNTQTVEEALTSVSPDKTDRLAQPEIPKGVELERISALQPGDTMRDLPMHLQHRSYKRRANRRVSDGLPPEKRGGAPAGIRRLVPSEPSKAITGAATREFIHPIEDRRLTLREAATLQTFPGNFRFIGSRSDIATMIGNAIPPRFAKALGTHLLTLLDSPNTTVEGGVIRFQATYSSGTSPALKAVTQMIQKRYGSATPAPTLF